MPDNDTGTGTSADDSSNNASAGGADTGAAAATNAGTAAAYPADTPVSEMTFEQQAAYWKTQSRKHESRVKGLGTPDEIKEWKNASTELAKLKKSQATDAERAVMEAREQTETVMTQKFARQLVAAEFRAATAGLVKPDDLSDFLAPMDLSFFLNDDRTVDLDKITQLASKLVGAQTGTSGDAQNGASNSAFPFIGQGKRDTGKGDPFAAGRAAFEARKGQRSI